MSNTIDYDGLVDLAAADLGGFVLLATDDFFAEKENLVKASEPVFIDGKYTDKGKWMDGWESQRRVNDALRLASHRPDDHDYAVIRLGLAGCIRKLIVDTTHFKGNAPQSCQLEASNGDDHFEPLLAQSALKPDTKNVFTVNSAARATHVRLRIYPDGGVARLRVLGEVMPEERLFWRPAAIDLAAVEHGGTIGEVSDRFFGPPSNLLLPGRGVNMGDGWETARRRTPGTDWAVIKLGKRGVIERVELDTHFFKGNAPQAVTIEARDGDGVLRPFLAKTALEPHKRHVFYPDRRTPVTQVRVHIHPHGGVNRLRLYGFAVDAPALKARLDSLTAVEEYLSFNGSKRWAEAMRRSHASVREWFSAAEQAWWALDTGGWLEAFAAHPRLGVATNVAVAKREQAGIATDDELARLNDAYFAKFGFIFILFASGKRTSDVLEALTQRLDDDRTTELENAACEQAKITRLRMERWLAEERK